jgi:threonyl-tRNA synthetase
VPVSPEKHGEGAEALAKELRGLGVRADIDNANETLGNRVRKAVGSKIPYIVAVGDKEIGGEEWMIRMRGVEKQEKMSKAQFIERILSEIKDRKS